jgi:hypothetical protein
MPSYQRTIAGGGVARPRDSGPPDPYLERPSEATLCKVMWHGFLDRVGYWVTWPLRGEARKTARRLGKGMPFVHYPASAEAETVAGWGSLRSLAARGVPAPQSRAALVRHQHVFAYAGPCCYAGPTSLGTLALYFRPERAAKGDGKACPFDTGALLERPILLPWAKTLSSDLAIRFVEGLSVCITRIASSLGDWLAYCYSRPERYLDTMGDLYADGFPNRTKPAAIREHNGPGRSGADRRAWTWEARFKGPLEFADVLLANCAGHLAQEVTEEFGARVRFVRTFAAGGEALYRESGEILRELTK